MPPYQHKTFKFSVKAVDDEQGLIEAYGSVFNNVDLGRDVVEPGAFTRTIQESKARIQEGKAKFFAVMLWNHDAQNHLPIGGWYDLKEDTHGLLCKGRIILTTSLGRDVYELIKAGVINEFSIGYDVYQGGATWDKSTGNRRLTSLQLFEISPVIWAMNTEALLVNVKSVCGDTGLPIGPRDESWDGSEAHNQIVAWATKEGGGIDAAKMKQVHLQVDGDADKITSYHYPFCNIVDGSPRINVGGVKACAAALSGARNADPGADAAGMRKKVETLYSRINKKYPDAEPLTPPWKDDSGKASAGPARRKDFYDHYREEEISDWLGSDFTNLVCALKKSLLDIFAIGDSPQDDVVNTVLNDGEGGQGFIGALKAWVQKGVDLDVSNYLSEQTAGYSPSYYDYDGPYYGGYMSNPRELAHKHGRAISAANAQTIQGHIDAVHNMANKAMAAMKEHVKALHSAADDLATILQGSEAAYGTDRGEPDSGQQEGKRFNVPARPRPAVPPIVPQEPADDDIAAALTRLRSIKQYLH